MTIKKIGFACKLSEIHPTKGIVPIPSCNFKTTTITWLNRQSHTVSYSKLWELLKHNITAANNVIQHISSLPASLRCFRLGSEFLPLYTAPVWKKFYSSQEVQDYCHAALHHIGKAAKSANIRLSFHPGPFVCLASDNPTVITNSIEELEYHATMAQWLGFGNTFQDMKINVHISGKRGPDGIRDAYKHLSVEARNCITIENDENTWGLAACLSISDLFPIVLDLHHHWCREGVFIQPSDGIYGRVIDSWRGIRPIIHYSYSRSENLPTNCDHTQMLDRKTLLEAGHNKQKLRAHSDFFPNSKTNEWALSFIDSADIMCEAKGKNLAAMELHACAVQNNLFI